MDFSEILIFKIGTDHAVLTESQNRKGDGMNQEFAYFIQYLLITLDGLTSGIMIEGVFGGFAPGKFGKKSVLRICSFWLMEIVLMMPDWLMHRRPSQFLNILLQVLGYTVVTRFVYRTTWKRGFESYVLYFIGGFTGELLYHLTHPDLLGTQHWQNQLMISTIAPFEILMLFTKLLTMKMTLVFRNNPKYWFLDPMILLLGLIGVGIASLTPVVLSASPERQASTLIIFYPGLLLACLSILYLMISGRLSEPLFTKKTRPNRSELEGSQILSEEELKMAKLRHDAKNIGAAVETLIENSKTEEVLEILQKMDSEKVHSEAAEQQAAE